MIQRSEVEALLQTATDYQLGEWQIDSGVIAELCRTWLAVQDADTVAITQCNQIAGASDFDYGDMSAACQKFKPGQCVRLVADTGVGDE